MTGTKKGESTKARHPDSAIAAEAIEAVGESECGALQGVVTRHIDDEFRNGILAVMYDDIMWHRLNRRA
jgi:hypothetical protein